MQSYVKACDMPCDLDMPIADDYLLTVAGGKSTNLKFSGQPGQTVIIDVNPPNDGGKVGGVLMIIAGALGLIVGGVVDLVGVVAEGATSASDNAGNTKGGSDGILITGLIITGVSLGLGIGGIVVFFKSGNTDVNTHTALLDLPTAPRTDDRYVRTPVWHTPSSFERAAQGPTQTTLPIFSHAF